MANGVSSRTAVEMASDSRRHRGRGSAGRGLAATWRTLLARARGIARRGWSHAVIPVGSGFLLGRAILFDTLHPFGIAYVVALAAAGYRGRALMAALGVLFGSIYSLGDPGESLIVLFVVWFVAGVIGGLFALPSWTRIIGAVLAATTLRLVSAAFSQGDLMTVVLVGAIDLTAALALLPGLARLFDVSEKERGEHAARADEGAAYVAVVASFFLFVSALLLGLHGVQWYSLSLQGLFIRVLLLLAAVTGGAGVGAVTGTLLGLLTVLGSGGLVWEGVLYAASGLVAGFGSGFGRFGAIVGLLTAHLLLSPYASDGPQIASALLHCIIAASIILLIPSSTLRIWKSRLRPLFVGVAARSYGRNAGSASQGRLARLAQVFEQAAAVFSPQEATAASSSRVPTRWQGRRSEEQAWFDEFTENVFEKVCGGCSHQSVCWDTHVYETCRDLLTVLNYAQRIDVALKPMEAEDLPTGLRQRCIQPRYFAAEVGNMLIKHDRLPEGRPQQLHAPMQRQLSGIADIISGIATELHRLENGSSKDGVRVAGQPRFQLQTDYVQVAGDASDVSGDSFQKVELPRGRVAIIVCDGMGSGAKAAVESTAVIAMLRRFLEAGFDLHFCVQTINAVMLLGGREESFVTVDMCVIDLWDGKARLIKTGAAPTFIHRGSRVEVVRADSLPVGILPRVELYEATVQLQLGDLVVMMSDGGLELSPGAADKTEAVRRKIERMERPRPRRVVDELFAPSHPGVHRRLPDDVTIVAAQLVPSVIPAG